MLLLTSRALTRWGIAMIAAFAALVSAQAAWAIEPPFAPPEGRLQTEDFSGVRGAPTNWHVALGTWQADGRTYNSTSAASSAVTTIFEYLPISAGSEPDSQLRQDIFTLRARMRDERGGANSLVGLVYLYLDPANYDEVVFSPTGVAYLRRMIDGVMQTHAAATYVGGSQGMWFSVELRRTADTTSVRVNGVPVFTDAPWVRRTQFGRIGLSTYNTTARFNKLSISIPWGQQPLTEDFSDGVADGFGSANGTFVVSGGTFNNTAVRATNESLAPIDFGTLSTTITSHAVRVRMLNPYGGSGNLVGISFNHGTLNAQPAFDEVVFSPTGVAQIRHVVGRTITVLKSGSHTAGRNVWFDVTFVNRDHKISVSVDGEPVFTEEELAGAFDPDVPVGDLGLITHWAPGKFDDFSFNYDPLVPSLQTFDIPVGAVQGKSGTWTVQGGTLNSVGAGIADIVVTDVGGVTDYRYKARLLNQYGASGNLVGLLFSYGSSSPTSTPDYLEAVFSPTGQAYVHLYIEGTRYRLATGAHNVASNAWFDAEVIRKGTTATVLVNGVPVIGNVQVGHLDGGNLGVVTHWAKGRFDNLSTKHAVP